MHRRPPRALSAVSCALVLLLGLLSSALAAGAKDKDAQKLYDAAINDDYLNADFPKAEKKLKDAVTKCGSDCSSELLAKIHVALGTVYAVGLSKPDDAKASFVTALKTDPKAALDPALTTPDLTRIFEEAKKEVGAKGGAPPKPSEQAKPPPSDAQHTPPPESQVNTPLPIYVEPSEEIPLSKVTLRYKPFGATQYKSVEMKSMGKGFGVELPCEDLTTTGDLKYFFVFTGADNEAAGGLGSNKEPFKVAIKSEIEGDAPKLPGKKAPDQCKEKSDCPPGLAGCDSGKPGKRGDKTWGSSCDQTADCKEGLACVNGTCEEDKSAPGATTAKKRMNLVSVGVQFDLLFVKSAQNVCDGSDPAKVCFLKGTSNQFFGSPITALGADGQPTDAFRSSGFAFAGARILVGYDRQLLDSVGLTLGLRLGYAFGGPPAPQNVDAMGNPTVNTNIGPAKGFIPFHGEARLSYYLLGSMMDDKKFRPYVFAGGGFAHLNASLPVLLCDSKITQADASAPVCTKTSAGAAASVFREVSAYQISGLGFVDFGAGTTFGITPLFGISAELKVMFMLPTFGVALAPTLGPVFNF